MESERRSQPIPEFGALLREHRLAAGLSQEALAERASMSSEGISALERGHRRTPHRDTLALLIRALKLDDERRGEFEAAAARSARTRRGGAHDPFADGGAPLPLSLTSFVGRDAELREIAELARGHRLITLTGTGGIGKTQTALRIGSAIAQEGEETAIFVGLGSTGRARVVETIASVLGVQEVPNRSLVGSLITFLRNRPLLLILDNCEHVVAEAAAAASAILGGCPRVRILATSREPLKIAGERTYRLPSLVATDAVALFADRARAVDHRFALTEENAPVVADLCERLDGIPLAIELAAARVNLLSVGALLERLDERFRILTSGERVALARQQTMRAAIDWSYDLLNPAEQLLFERLSVFVDGWTLEAAEAVAAGDGIEGGDVFDLLSSLAEKSLVVADLEGIEPRYHFLESTHAFALEKTEQRGERTAVARRHAQWAASLAERAQKTASTTPVEHWAREFEPELENARAAIDWALVAGESSLAAVVASGFTGIWRMNHGVEQPRRWLNAVLAEPKALEPAIAARVWLALSTVSFGMHRVEAARKALELGVGAADPRRDVGAHYQTGIGFLETGRLEEAEAANERVLALCKEHDLTRASRYAAALDIRARIAAIRGETGEARRWFTEALSLFAALGDDHETILIRINMGELEYRAGDVVRALEFASSAAEAARRVGSRHREITAQDNLAAYRLALGDVTGARAGGREALALAPFAPSLEVAIAVQHLAAVAALAGDARRAARLGGYVDAWYRKEACEREFTEERSREMLMGALRAQLSDAELAVLAAEGAGLSEEQAVAEALDV